jgi:hypothetical protein
LVGDEGETDGTGVLFVEELVAWRSPKITRNLSISCFVVTFAAAPSAPYLVE